MVASGRERRASRWLLNNPEVEVLVTGEKIILSTPYEVILPIILKIDWF
jgi:hypothetical protein